MKNIHLIMSSYNDAHLFETFRHLVDLDNTEIFFYKKNDKLDKKDKIERDGFIEIANYGSCDYAFFKHIVDNYDNLADHNIFTKLNTNFPNRHEVFLNCTKYDFYQCGSGPVSQIWYDGEKHDITNFKTKYEKISQQDIRKTKNNRGELADYAGGADFQVDWFCKIFGERLEEPVEIITYEHGPCFSVSKEAIQQHSIEVYQELIDMFHPFNSWSYETAVRCWSKPENNPVKGDPYDTKFQIWGVGRFYHDELCRFYRTFFTYKKGPNLKSNQI